MNVISMTIRFKLPVQLPEMRVRKDLLPAPQIEAGLVISNRESDRQAHAILYTRRGQLKI